MKQQGGFSNMTALYEPIGEVKMSEVIEILIQPYMAGLDTLNAYRNLVGVAVLAWNATLLPPNAQEEADTALGNLSLTPEGKENVRAFMRELMARKMVLFPDLNRFIVGYEVTEVRDGWHLSIASTLASE
jgi:hypothetical protein